jgi:hypothetical protein
MVKTLEYGKEHWKRKTAGKGEIWHKRVTSEEAKKRYDENLKESAKELMTKLGLPVKNTLTDTWYSHVSAVKPEAFNKAIEGKEDRWAENLARAIAGA